MTGNPKTTGKGKKKKKKVWEDDEKPNPLLKKVQVKTRRPGGCKCKTCAELCPHAPTPGCEDKCFFCYSSH